MCMGEEAGAERDSGYRLNPNFFFFFYVLQSASLFDSQRRSTLFHFPLK